MFALGIRYLNGWSMAAADGAKKQRAEWPPHPDRVFMALAAAWFETGGMSTESMDDEYRQEGEALRWLEALPPPAIAASDATTRTTVVSYVPVNDAQIGSKLPTDGGLDRLKGAGLTVLPEHRSRQPRSFPVAIPHESAVHLIWREAELGGYRCGLERLAAKVTHVGHSASFAQVWVEDDSDIVAAWEPVEGIAVHRLRIPSAGRLDGLIRSCNRTEWIGYHDLRGEIERAELDAKAMEHPPRTVWRGFADAVLLATESETGRHPEYPGAKAGDTVAAANLVRALVSDTGVAAARALIARVSESGEPVLASAHAYERESVNAIPVALAELLGERLGLASEATIVQTNVVSHTGADGYGRLARQARFKGEVVKGCEYVMVGDFIGQGGTLANLRGWIEKRGGRVVGAVALTGKPYSATLNPSREQLHELRERHGPDFEKWWREHFGHTFDCLTQSECRYLARSPDVDTIRNRLAEAQQGGNGPAGARSPREQKRHIADLKARLRDRFPDGPPATPLRPIPARWQGYDRPPEVDSTDTRHSVFDPRIIVLGIKDKQVYLPATLKLTAALRGLLMGACPEQPPPEWFSGHRRDGTPTSAPHLALAPLPFVGSQHADGRIMGLALVLPRVLDPMEAGRCLEPCLLDPATGLAREHRLFSAQWLGCTVELEARERLPRNLDPNTWTRPARVWASVTPVVLNRHFDGKDKWDRAADSVKGACEHIGLPRPREVLLHPVSMVEGTPHAREYPQLARKSDGGRRSQNHAVIVFDEPVHGPVIVGAGRFRGYGLCRPMDEGGNERG